MPPIDFEPAGRGTGGAAGSLHCMRARVYEPGKEALEYGGVPMAEGGRGDFTSNERIIGQGKDHRRAGFGRQCARAAKCPAMSQDGTRQDRRCDPRGQGTQQGLCRVWNTMREDIIACALTRGDKDFTRIFRMLPAQRAVQGCDARLVDHRGRIGQRIKPQRRKKRAPRRLAGHTVHGRGQL